MISMNQLQELYNSGIKEINVKRVGGNTEKLRLFTSTNGDLCYFGKGSRRRGYPLYGIIGTIEEVLPARRVDAGEEWRKSWQSVADRLNKSGLWTDYKAEVELALSIGYDRMHELYKYYHQSAFIIRNDAKDLETVRAYSKDLIGLREDGSEYVAWSIIWTFTQPARVKKMRFYNGNSKINALIMDEIKSHMESKLPYKTCGSTSYDVSFTYDAVKNRAWYSEEYRGCGNGHYYLALDATHAVFSEDD